MRVTEFTADNNKCLIKLYLKMSGSLHDCPGLLFCCCDKDQKQLRERKGLLQCMGYSPSSRAPLQEPRKKLEEETTDEHW